MEPESDIPPEDFSDDEAKEDNVGSESDLSGDGGVMKKIIKSGFGACPEPCSDVTVHYVGKLVDGSVFDSSRDRDDPFKFRLGKGEVIKGWDMAVAKMKKGETSLVTVEPQYGYGDREQGKIPPNSTLQFEIELLNWVGEKDISKNLDSSLFVKQTKDAEGSSWENPTFDSTVTFTAKCISGNASSYDNATIKIGHNQVSEKGLCRALRKMAKKEEGVVTAKAKTRYNPLDTDQVWEVQLTSFEKAPAAWSLEAPQKFEKTQELKERGNQFYKEKNWRFAGKFYKHAFEFVNSDYKFDEAQKKEAKKIKAAVASNHAAVALQLRNWESAKELATKALTNDPLNTKALLRRGKAQNELDLLDLAKKDLTQAIYLATEADDKASLKEAKLELGKIAQKDKAKFQQEQKIFGGWFEKAKSWDDEFEQERLRKKEADAATLKAEEEERKAKEQAAAQNQPQAESTSVPQDAPTEPQPAQ